MIEQCQYSLHDDDNLLIPPFESGGGPNFIVIPIFRLKKLSDLAME